MHKTSKDKAAKPNTLAKSLPLSLQAPLNGWKETTEDRAYTLLFEEEYVNVDYSDIVRKAYYNMADKVAAALGTRGKDVTSSNIFTFLISETTLVKLSEFTTEKLTKMGHAPTNVTEYKRFLGTRWLRSRFRMGRDSAF